MAATQEGIAEIKKRLANLRDSNRRLHAENIRLQVEYEATKTRNAEINSCLEKLQQEHQRQLEDIKNNYNEEVERRKTRLDQQKRAQTKKVNKQTQELKALEDTMRKLQIEIYKQKRVSAS